MVQAIAKRDSANAQSVQEQVQPLQDYEFSARSLREFIRPSDARLADTEPATPTVEPDVEPTTVPVPRPDETPQFVPGTQPTPDADPVPDQCPIRRPCGE